LWMWLITRAVGMGLLVIRVSDGEKKNPLVALQHDLYLSDRSHTVSLSSPWLYRLMTMNKASHKDAGSPQDTITMRSNKEFVGHCNAFVFILEQPLIVVEVCNHWIQMICSLLMFLRLPTKVAASGM
jgi:hypothetical protein